MVMTGTPIPEGQAPASTWELLLAFLDLLDCLQGSAIEFRLGPGSEAQNSGNHQRDIVFVGTKKPGTRGAHAQKPPCPSTE
jgi:hypothetical protein